MLKALARYILRNDAPETTLRPREQGVTRDELDAVLAKFEQRQEFELGEWFDKFSALHARTEKRVQRDRARQAASPAPEAPPQGQPPMSVLQFRRPWSV